MRIVICAIAKLWIMLQSRQALDSSDTDLDEAPKKKHPRLTYDCKDLQRPNSTMDMSAISDSSSSPFRDISEDGNWKISRTREVGVHFVGQRNLVSTNDKCIMVGTTGIDALKAKYGDDFSNFEIIQDVGYSSESSTHLSSDDVSDSIRVYSFSPPRRMDSLVSALGIKAELTKMVELTPTSEKIFKPNCLGSSSCTSHNDSGLGAMDTSIMSSDGGLVKEIDHCDDVLSGSELEEVVNVKLVFSECNDDVADLNTFALHDFDSDGSFGDIHSRRSITSDAQVFYKMTSVDSEVGDVDVSDTELLVRSGAVTNSSHEVISHPTSEEEHDIIRENLNLSEIQTANLPTSTQEIVTEHVKQQEDSSSKSRTRIFQERRNPSWESQVSDGFVLDIDPKRTSTPVSLGREGVCSSPDDRGLRLRQRRRRSQGYSDHQESLSSRNSYPRSRRVRDWLNRLEHGTDTCVGSHSFAPTDESHNEGDDEFTSHHHRVAGETSFDSSCDASYEYTTTAESDIDGSMLSSTEDNGCYYSVCRSRTMGSAETVIPLVPTERLHLHEAQQESVLLLPPPPSPTPPTTDDSDVLSTDPEGTPRRRRATLKATDGYLLPLGDIQNTKSTQSSSATAVGCNSNSNQRPLAVPAHSCTDSFRDCSCVMGNKNEYATTRRQTRSLPNVLKLTDSVQSGSNSDHRHSFPNCNVKSPRKSPSSSSTERRTKRKFTCSSRARKSRAKDFGPRKRHWSQVQTPGLCQTPQMKLLDNIQRNSALQRDRVVASPDLVLNNVEEQSIVSDQVWDGYQEMPYLSEAYSEPVDEDTVKKLTEFGDDYGFAIGISSQSSTGIDSKRRMANSNSNHSKTLNKIIKNPLDSDSDTEDLYDVLEDAYKALQFVVSSFERKTTVTDSKCAELLATCQTHLHCLHTISEYIEADGKWKNFTEEDIDDLHDLINKWTIFQGNIDMIQKMQAIQEDMDILRDKMLDISFQCRMTSKDVSSYEDLEKRIEVVQVALISIDELKQKDLIDVNLRVHRIVSEHSGHTYSSLKADITKLYCLFEDIYVNNSERLTELNTLQRKWSDYTKRLENLFPRIKAFQIDQQNPGVLQENLRGVAQEVKELWSNEASYLEIHLHHELWETLSEDLFTAHSLILQTAQREKFPKLVEMLQQLTSRSCDHPNPSLPEEDAEDEAATAGLVEDQKPELFNAPIDTPMQKKESSHPSKLWRIFRASLSIQLAVAVLYCFAYALEPHCCDLLNNMSFSLVPQLRHIKGPPPI